MAKINSLVLRKANGKLAGTTIYTTEGVTIMREVNEKPKNPQSTPQMTHRCKLSNLVNGYRLLRPWILQAYPKNKALNSFYNTFVSKNLKNSQIYLPKDVAAKGVFVPAAYKMSEGNLAVNVMNTMDVTGTDAYLKALDLPSSWRPNQDHTVGEMSQKLREANPGLFEGAQVSFILVLYNVETGKTSMFSESFIIDSQSEVEFIASFKAVTPTIHDATLSMKISEAQLAANVVGAYCVVSSMNGSKLEVTSATMAVAGKTAFNTDDDIKRAIASYAIQTADNALNPASPEVIVK